MSNKRRILLAMVLCLCMLFGNVCTTHAAEKKQPDMTKLTFDVDYYYNTYPDLQAAIGYDYDGLYEHYLVFGLKEGRSGSEEFNCQSYKARYKDLRVAFGNKLTDYCMHYEIYGKNEKRDAVYDAELVRAAKEAGDDVIGTYTTLYDAEIPRAINVTLAASRINGVVIAPGESFSFSQTVLPRTAKNGYVVASVISGGKFVPGIGGGICQVSSTLYAAMVDAQLPATERHPHSLKVNYIPEELNATISGNVKDLKFENVFEENIQIVATAEDGVLTVNICK